MSTAARGRSLELYFVDGDPEGMLTAEVFNWTGHVLYTPRTRLSEALKRKEAGYTGVYLLLGEQEGAPCAYVGEAEDIGRRIRQHDVGKDWWSLAVLVSTAANNLNKAHVKYLEARLIERAADVGRVPLENGNKPSRPGLSEAAEANMEGFLDYLFMVLPALRIDLFVSRKRRAFSTDGGADTSASEAPIFELRLKRSDLRATARFIDGEFVVQAGSDARIEWIGSGQLSYAQLYEELVRSGVLVEQGSKRVFRENYAFASTSAAAAIVTGRSAAGPISWFIQGTDRTYKDWEREQLSKVEGEAA